jgi:methionyl-tRNA formyltransferase
MKVSYTGRKSLGVRCQGVLSRLGCEFVPLEEATVAFSVLGTHIYTLEEIASVPCGIVNLHLAPLPQYRGFYAFTHAIANGEDRFSVTLHYVDEGIDTGPVIATKPVPVPDTPVMLMHRATEAGFRLFDAMAPDIIEAAKLGKQLPASPQEGQARYYGRDSLPEGYRGWD